MFFAYTPFILFIDDADIDDWLDFVFFLLIIFFLQSIHIFFAHGHIHAMVDDWLDFLLFLIVVFHYKPFIFCFRRWGHKRFVKLSFVLDNYCFRLQSIYIFFDDGDIDDWLHCFVFDNMLFLLTKHLYFFSMM